MITQSGLQTTENAVHASRVFIGSSLFTEEYKIRHIILQYFVERLLHRNKKWHLGLFLGDA